MANEPFDLSKNLITMLGLESLPEERRLSILQTASELVQKNILIRLMENLSDEDAAEGEQLGDDPEKFLAFLVEKSGLDLMELVNDEVEKLKNGLRLATDVDAPVESGILDDDMEI